ncbi:uncharacterized protein [Drosophila bipectinata]|uniref:uncharacterized protein n=1 Tax=Drosophila bipectinata TaxID=42026 RepID=UPI001C8AE81A|nr:uncharacterized protein LOC108118622 [Drosophila bipectinata]
MSSKKTKGNQKVADRSCDGTLAPGVIVWHSTHEMPPDTPVIPSPYEMMRQRNCKAAKFTRGEKYLNIRPPESKCNHEQSVAFVEEVVEEGRYCMGNAVVDDALAMWDQAENKRALKYYGVGDPLYLPEAVSFNRVLSKSIKHASMKVKRKGPPPPPAPPHPPQPVPVCQPYILNREALKAELQKMPTVQRKLQPAAAFEMLYCNKAVDPQDPFGVNEDIKMISLEEALDMKRPVRPPKHGLRRNHWYCPPLCGGPENSCTAYEWAKYKLDPRPYDEEFQKWYAAQVFPNEEEPHNYDQLYERFLKCFDMKPFPDPECVAMAKCCPEKAKTDDQSTGGGNGGKGGDGGDGGEGGSGGDADEGVKRPVRPVRPPVKPAGDGDGDGDKGDGDGDGKDKGKDKDKGDEPGAKDKTKPDKGKDKSDGDEGGDGAKEKDKDKDKDKGKDKGKDKDKGKIKDIETPQLPKQESNLSMRTPQGSGTKGFNSDIFGDRQPYRPGDEKPKLPKPKPGKGKGKGKGKNKGKGDEKPPSEPKGPKCPTCPPDGCPCSICDCLYPKKDEDSPIMKCLMRKDKERQLREYLRIMRHREYMRCRGEYHVACQNKADPIAIDDCFCKNPKIAEYCDCLGALQQLQQLLGKRRNPIVNNELLFNLDDLRARVAQRMCDCL